MSHTRSPALNKLLGLIDNCPGFSGLGASVKIIGEMADAEDGGVKEITAAILRDAPLAARLLRMANSARNALGGRNVATVDRAITMLGVKTVRSLAMSTTMLEHLSNKPQSSQLHAEIAAACFCGNLAAEITRCNSPRSGQQEAQVCGLLQNLGRMMALYHLYDEIEKSRALMVEKNLTEDEAAAELLQADYATIGAAVAHHWNLPLSIEHGIAATMDKKRPAIPKNLDWAQTCALFSRRVTDALFRLPENQEKVEIDNSIRIFQAALRLDEEEVQGWIEKILQDTDKLLAEAAFPCRVEQARMLLRRSSERVVDRLSSQDSLTKKDVFNPSSKKPIEVFQQALRVMHDAFGFDRTLLCLRDASGDLVAVAGVGRNALQAASLFRCRGQMPDIFRLALEKKVDMFIADTDAPSISEFLPDWYYDHIGAPCFMLLSLTQGGRELGLIYGDYAEPPDFSPQEIAEREEVKEWRGQLQTALREHADRPRR